jgi:hypothetical protein
MIRFLQIGTESGQGLDFINGYAFLYVSMLVSTPKDS